MKIDLNKKYRYRNGEPARVLCVDAPSDFPVVSLDGGGNTATHDLLGREYGSEEESEFDLIEVREPLECWVRIRTNGEIDFEEFPDNRQPNKDYCLFREVID